MEALRGTLAARGLVVSSVPGRGRCLFSTKDFCPGDVIIFQEPYASTPNKVRCDGCFTSSGLKKCSTCQVAHYCSIDCQKLDWKLHRLECQALVGLSEERKKMLTSTIRLVVRLLLRRKLQDEQVIPTTVMDNYELVNELVSHISDIDEKQLVLYAQMASLVKLVLPSMEINLKDVSHIFSKLACNGHTICDDELRPLGSGLYPVISTINHSCIPNSVLLFEGRKGVVRATEPIAKGSEVLITYIETSASIKMRQNFLEQYFFQCTCPCCTKEPFVELEETAIMVGFRCKDMKCNGFLLLDVEKETFTCQHCGLSRIQEEINKLSREVEDRTANASISLSSGNHFEARILYKTVEELQGRLCHRFSINLMKTRDTLMKICMELEDWHGALAYCRLTIPIYQRVYSAVHPMLGLQYYTCGKLEWLLENTMDAFASFTKAADILRITHGSGSPFVNELLSKLADARTEALAKKLADEAVATTAARRFEDACL